ncbi:MAG TPA: HIT domain-containing protein, partial [Candidatus Acidoferrales bacterium]|nr:HIT domain-containing protein [Candidatus Acidoferrales bacterium]
MQVLWAPWRGAYFEESKATGCIFCTARDSDDLRQHLVLEQEPAIVMLNKYPYASAHLMVAPRRHTADLAAMPAPELHTLMSEVQRTAAILADVLHADGMNIGLNLGAAAGAGIVDHLHWH